VLLLSLLSLLSLLNVLGVIRLTQYTGIGASSGSAGQSGPKAATTSPTASPTPTSGWLQVSPTSVEFGCSDHQRTQIVVLQNRGPGHVHWRAGLSGSPDQAGVAISPGDGDLGPGESTAIQLQSIGGTARQEVAIYFSVTDAQAGPPVSVSFTATGCN